jgi:tape measure domain-containing protein
MSDAQSIAKLVATLGFTVEDTQLNTFLTKLQTTITVLKELRATALSKITFSVGINPADMLAAQKLVESLGGTRTTKVIVDKTDLIAANKLVESLVGKKRTDLDTDTSELLAAKKLVASLTARKHSKVDVDSSELVAAKKLLADLNARKKAKIDVDSSGLINAKKMLSSLGNVKVRIKDVAIGGMALSTARVQLSEGLGKAKIKINNASISKTALASAKAEVRESIKLSGLQLPIRANTRDLGKQLRTWILEKGKKFKIHVHANVSSTSLTTSLKAAIEAATLAAGRMRNGPKIQVGIDKAHLKTEIRDALAQIRREVRIKIDLAGRVGGNLGGGGGAGRGKGGFRGAAATGGVVGTAMNAGRAAIPGFGAVYGVAQLSKISQDYIAAQTALKAVSGEDYDSNYKFLNDIGSEMGKAFRDTAPMFTSVLAASREAIGSETTQNMFRGIMKYGTVMGLDDEAMKGSLRAISQMFSKDKIMAEEAQGQFAERMPAGMQLLAKAHNTSVPQLRIDMQKGLLDPKDLIPELGKIMEQLVEGNGAYGEALKTSRVAQGRMNYEFEKFVKAFASSGFDETMGDFFRGLAETFGFLSKHSDTLAKGFRVLMTPILAVMRIIKNTDWGALADNLGLSSGKLKVLALVIAGILMPWTRMITLVALAITLFDDLQTHMQGGQSLYGKYWGPAIEFAKTYGESLVGILASIGLIAKSGGIGGAAGGAIAKVGWLALAYEFGTLAGTAINEGMMKYFENEWVGMWDAIFNRIDMMMAPFNPDAAARVKANEPINYEKPLPTGISGKERKRLEDEDAMNKMVDILKSLGFAYNNGKLVSAPSVPGDLTSKRLDLNIKISAEKMSEMYKEKELIPYLEKAVDDFYDKKHSKTAAAFALAR